MALQDIMPICIQYSVNKHLFIDIFENKPVNANTMLIEPHQMLIPSRLIPLRGKHDAKTNIFMMGAKYMHFNPRHAS